jgi:pantoate--beta-alanine ligase
MTVATPRLVHTRNELRVVLAEAAHRPLEAGSTTVGVVMTMGALHAGHRELIRVARKRCDVIIVTVFLNPLQFGPNEDLSRYPQTLDSDLALCTDESVDVVFAPSARDVYPEGRPSVRVAAGQLGDVLEGASRPGHFDGVLTVVAKLLHMTRPKIAYYGQKDAQQLLLIRRMVTDLDFPVAVEAVPTVRDPDGLALSSRNAYLTASDRITALSLSRALRAGVAAAPEGPAAVRRIARECLERVPEIGLDYLVLVDPEQLTDVPDDHVGEALLAVAARVGSTRLIDNELVLIPESGRPSPQSH